MLNLVWFLPIHTNILELIDTKSSLNDKFYPFPLIYLSLVGLII